MEKVPADDESVDKPLAEGWPGTADFGVESPEPLTIPNGDNETHQQFIWQEDLQPVRHGHFFSYVGLFLFTAVVYFRPYELIPALRGASTMAFWIAILTLVVYLPSQLRLEGNLSARPKEVKWILLLGITAFLSVPFSDDAGRSWDAFTDYVKIIIMFVVMINVVRTWWRLQGLLILALGVSCFLSFNAFLDYSAGNFKSDGYRVVGIIGNMFSNPNDLALHLVTMTALTIGLVLSSRSLPLKIIYAVCAVMMVGAITFTYSRGGFLGLAAVGVFLTWRLARRQRFIAYAAMVIAITSLIIFAPGGYGNRILSITGNDGSSVARTDDLKRSILIMLRHPLFGIGMTNYVLRSNNNTATHNAYTQVGADMGVFALAAYLMFLTTPFKRLRKIEQETLRTDKRDARFYYLSVGLQASLVGYMVSSFFASVGYLWNVYYLVGYAICLHRLYVEHLKESAASNAVAPEASHDPSPTSALV